MKVTFRRTMLLAISWSAILVTSVYSESALEQKGDLERIINLGREHNRALEHAEYLVNQIGSRPAYSLGFLKACKWAADEFSKFGLDNVHVERVSQMEADLSANQVSIAYQRLYESMFGENVIDGMVPVCNVVAEISGSEWPDEYVIVGAHLDCVDQSPGATDNAVGVAAVMEAARIISAAGVKPRRTIRFILFGGEEVGLIGSRGYVADHPEILPNVSAVYIMDHGTNVIAGIPATKPLLDDLRQIFKDINSANKDFSFEVTEVDYYTKFDSSCCPPRVAGVGSEPAKRGGCVTMMSGCTTVPGATVERAKLPGNTPAGQTISEGTVGGCNVSGSTRSLPSGCAPGCSPSGKVVGDGAHDSFRVMSGGTDHLPFLEAGIPAFWWKQEVGDTVSYPAHTAEDTFDMIVARYLEHSAIVMAIGAINTANLNNMLSREKLLEP